MSDDTPARPRTGAHPRAHTQERKRFKHRVVPLCLLIVQVIANRNALHCSYPNRSRRTRITLNFGFHKRSAVLAATAKPTATARGGGGQAGIVPTQVRPSPISP